MQQQVSDRADALARAARGELLTLMDLAAIFYVGPSRAHALRNAGTYDIFKTKPAIGVRCFSGVKVYRHIQGEPLEEPVITPWGRKRRA